MTLTLPMVCSYKCYNKSKAFLAVIFLQFGFAGMDILSKVALNHGMSNYVLVVYRHVVATLITAPFAVFLDRKVRPKMTLSIFIKVLFLALLEPVIDQNLYYIGMKYTSATFAATMVNILPAITFVMAWVCRLEKVDLTNIRSQAKLFGTVATVAGAMIITLVKGPGIAMFHSSSGSPTHEAKGIDISLNDAIKGSIMITIGCFSWAAFVILQAFTLKAYPAELSLTAWMCLLGTLEGAAVALVMEKGRSSVWRIGWDSRILAATYSGVFCSGLGYYLQGVVMKERGPVFVTAFNPLCMVIVAAFSSFLLAEKMYLGRIMGAMVIVVGLYMVIWGKGKDYNDEESSSEMADEKRENELKFGKTNGEKEDGNENANCKIKTQEHNMV